MSGIYTYVINSSMAKIAICAVAALGLCYVVFVQGAQSVEADRGTRAAEGIELTSEQAEDMTQAADAVSTLIQDASVDLSLSSSPVVNLTPAAQDAEADVKSEAWYIHRAESLVDRWGPRYAAAIDDIHKFEHRFRTTEDRLKEYFQEQSDITESVNSSDLRAELQNRDAEERAAYERWAEEGWELLVQAQEMREDLDDMDAVIRKQQLTVDMLSQYSEASSIPHSVKNLHASLSHFRKQSDELAKDLSSHVFN